MKRLLLTLVLGLGLPVLPALAEDSVQDAESLEPCINGGVSASGLFASQAEEHAYVRSLVRK